MTSLLTLDKLSAGYGHAPILQEISFAITSKDIGVIVGPNGAGKSTCLKSTFGLTEITGGKIYLGHDDITSQSTDTLVHKGMGFVPQEHNVFTSMTVHENLEMGAFIREGNIDDTLDEIYTLFPPLKEKRSQNAGELSGGQRQMVAMGRALMSKPKLLLLDEPTAGLSPKYMQEVFEQIVKINNTGVGILMVEQNARQALAFASIGIVLVSGKLAFSGSGKDLLNDPEVARSFLGMDAV